jgi:hypothetical protein
MSSHSQKPSTFENIQEFFDYESEYQSVALDLRRLIKKDFPELSEVKLFDIPWYRLKKNICFLTYRKDILHKDKTKDQQKFKLFIGFYFGYQLFDNYNLFEDTKHTMIKYIHLDTNTNLELIKDYIIQAIELEKSSYIK